MSPEHKQTATRLIKEVVLLQLKVLLGAARDLALGPLAMVAALGDLMFLKVHEPRYFASVLRFGEKSDRWIDVWSGGRDGESPPRENVDLLIARVEEVVRDPQTGARRARVLKRWAERQLAKARERASAGMSTRMSADASSPPREPK